MRRVALLALGLAVVAASACAGPFAMREPVRTEAQSNQFGGLEFAPNRELLVIERRSDRPANPEEPRGGELRAKLEAKEALLPLKHTDVKAQVTLFIGSVTVTQQYHNPYDGKIEAVYVFPLPENAAVRDFAMSIGERRIRGVIREREEATRIYLEARRQGYVASLLTQERANIFTQSVANIEPGKQIDITITYFHALKYAEGEYEFWFPMVVGPRFNPPGFAGGVGAVPRGESGTSGQRTDIEYLRPNEISAHDIALEVDIDAGVLIREIASPSHAVRVERAAEGRAKVSLSPEDRIPNKDFVLRWRVADRTIQGALATHRDDGGGYFALVLQPPARVADTRPRAREMVFVLDCSGSMSGTPLAIAKRAATRCLARLGPGDTFQVVRFSNRVSAMAEGPVRATPENVRKGVEYVGSLESSGGTMMEAGIRAALDLPPDPERYRIVSFMTDGFIGNDREVMGLVNGLIGSSRIFSFGVGSSVNRYLLEGMARVGRGVAAFIGPNESGDEAIDDLYKRIERPALTDIRIDWSGMEVSDLSPRPLPDLFVGRPVVITGRFSGRGRATVRIWGMAGEIPSETVIEVNLEGGTPQASIACLWARARIEDLTDEMTYAPSAEKVERIRDLALRHGLVSEFTAFIAVDSSARTAGEHGTTVNQPVPVPKGTRYETTVPERK